MAQNQMPIINSFFEIADTPGVHLTFDRGMGLDAILQQVGVVTYMPYKLSLLLIRDYIIRNMFLMYRVT